MNDDTPAAVPEDMMINGRRLGDMTRDELLLVAATLLVVARGGPDPGGGIGG